MKTGQAKDQEHDMPQATPDDTLLAGALARIRSLPELTGHGLLPPHGSALKGAAQRCIAVARGRADRDERDLLGWCAGLMLSVLDHSVLADQARLALWATLRHARGQVGSGCYLRLLHCWNALARGAPDLQVACSRRSWHDADLKRVVYDRSADGAWQQPRLTSVPDLPLSRLAWLAGYRAAEPQPVSD